MNENSTIELTTQQLIILSNALNEILNGSDAIEDWEFHTRIGAEKAEATELHKQLQQKLG